MKLQVAVLVVLVCGACAMTDEEASHFKNSGKYGGRIKVTDNGHSHTLNSDGMPDHPYVRVNPNDPQPRSDIYTLPKKPTVTDKPGCLAMGPIGMTITGTLIYDPLNADGKNAVEGNNRERFDQYGGHTDQHGSYHYHKIPGHFLYHNEPDKLLGVALDGFPIYGPFASDLGRKVKNTDLDDCHGRYVHGKYRYHFNDEFPYILGCYRGSHVTKAHTVFGSCSDTSRTYDGPNYGKPKWTKLAFDAKWGHLCACPRGQHAGPHAGQHAGPQGGQHAGQHAGHPQGAPLHNGTHASHHHHRPLLDGLLGRK